MSRNNYRPHILVLPEDDANRELANGFKISLQDSSRLVDVLPNAGGWMKVCKEFEDVHAPAMLKYPSRHMVLLLDFDESATRFSKVTECIPSQLADRVFVIGVWSEPEALRKVVRDNLESIGGRLADECRTQSWTEWQHPLLSHNESERQRMVAKLRPILFQKSTNL